MYQYILLIEFGLSESLQQLAVSAETVGVQVLFDSTTIGERPYTSKLILSESLQQLAVSAEPVGIQVLFDSTTIGERPYTSKLPLLPPSLKSVLPF